MTAQIIAIDVAALAAWRKRLDNARGEAIDGLLAFAKECYEFQQNCIEHDKKQGGSTYTGSMKDWYGLDQPTASRWAVVGANAPKLMTHVSSLPPSMRSLYLLCDVPDNVIAAQVTEKTTHQEARKLKATHATKLPKPFRIGWAAALVQRFGGDTRRYHAVYNANKARVTALPGFKDYITDPREATSFCDAWLRAFPSKVEIEKPPQREEFPEKMQNKMQRAMDAEIKIVHKEFNKLVEEEVKKRLGPLADQYGKSIDEAEKKSKFYDHLISDLKFFMTKDEYRLVLGCLHSDSRPTAERLNKAFNIMKRIGRVFDE